MKSVIVVVFMMVLVIACGKNKSADKTDETMEFTHADTMISRIVGDSVVTDSVSTNVGHRFIICNNTDSLITYTICKCDVLFEDTMGYEVITEGSVQCSSIKLKPGKCSKFFKIKEGAASTVPYPVEVIVSAFPEYRNTPAIIVEP